MIKNQALGGRTNRALILLGLFLGLVSAALVVVYLSKANDSGGGNVSAAKTPVIVASQDIPAGMRITEGMVTLKEISADAIVPDVFLKTDDVVKKVARVPIVAGEQIVPSKVTATGPAITDVENPPLAYVIPEGMRAVSVQVSSVIGVSGLIRPGDYVDVILTLQVRSDGASGGAAGGSAATSDQITRTILQNVQVLSVDQDIAIPSLDTEGAPSVGGDSDSNPEATTVTLAVSPVHGEVLTVAETCGQNNGGRLALALRGFGDSGLVGTRAQWADDGAPPSCAALLGLTSLQ